MERCGRLVDFGRRKFLSGAGVATAGAVASVGMAAPARAQVPLAEVVYPSRRLANVSELKRDEALSVAYPDDAAMGVLLKLGVGVASGVGPDRDIVGFSALCPHKGFPLIYRAADKSLNCPGHYSVFDCEKDGQQIWGHATQNLPQYKLRVAANGDIFAEGIDELLYGRLSNVLGEA